MASSATAPPPAEHDAHSMSSPTQSLDNLQAMLNLVLVSSGRYIKTPQAGPDVARMHMALKRSVFAANERFHDSLDELEHEVQRAQAVLRRDMALLKADRKKLEAAAKEKEAEKARQAAESSVKKPTPPPTEPQKVAPKEEPPAAAASPPKPKSPAPELNNKPVATIAEPTELKREMDDPTPADPPAAALPGDTEMENLDLGDTNGNDDFDFDALFNDAVMDGTGDDAQNQDVNMDASGPDLDFSLDEPAPSLLRGLEDFAKDSDDNPGGPSNANDNLDLDFAMTDLPAMPNLQSSEENNTTKPAENANVEAPTANNELDLDTITTNNIDDLFDLDYENPEATQFDDAFFGFGET